MDSATNLEAMAEMNELDDLGNLFEFGEIDLNTLGDPGQYGDPMQQQHTTLPNTPFQDLGASPPLATTLTQDFGDQQFGIAPNVHQKHNGNLHTPTTHPYLPEGSYQPSVPSNYNPYPQNFQFQSGPGFPSRHHVPPTPNSYEMHGESGVFLQQPQMDPQQRAILEQRYHVRKDDAIAFTPMVSPAGTPQYSILPEYTTPGAYFSPLTSPMLLAQNQQQAQMMHQNYRSHPNTAPNSNTISPVDPSFDVDMLDSMTLPESAGPKPRRSRRKVATPKTTGDVPRMMPSPAQLAQKRKSLSFSSNTPHSGADILQRSITSQPSSSSSQRMSNPDISENDSVSPESLTEGSMGPPPRPGSLNHSPAIVAQQHPGAAATPKSLLTIRGSQQAISDLQDPAQSNGQQWSGTNGLDELSLPESSVQGRAKPSLSQIDTSLSRAVTYDGTPRLSARKTPKLGSQSTPTSARPGSALASPSIVGSPMTASTPSAILSERKEGKSARAGKKRNSISASGTKLVSPALVPRISPSIKPLLPEGTPLNTASQAMLLASKSNYQNILEGNTLPGVTYPDHLSTGLTSKRTSHKVAEQGRRNRINDALKEMQSLIPPPSSKSSKSEEAEGEGDDEDDKSPNPNSKDEASSKSNSSKAATVELANEYIKKMQKDSAVRDADLAQLRLENEALRKRLLERSVNGSDAASSPATAGEDANMGGENEDKA